MIDKAKFNINCANHMNLDNITSGNDTSSSFLTAVCAAEMDSQRLGTTVRGYISPIGNYLTQLNVQSIH